MFKGMVNDLSHIFSPGSMSHLFGPLKIDMKTVSMAVAMVKKGTTIKGYSTKKAIF